MDSTGILFTGLLFINKLFVKASTQSTKGMNMLREINELLFWNFNTWVKQTKRISGSNHSKNALRRSQLKILEAEINIICLKLNQKVLRHNITLSLGAKYSTNASTSVRKRIVTTNFIFGLLTYTRFCYSEGIWHKF